MEINIWIFCINKLLNLNKPNKMRYLQNSLFIVLISCLSIPCFSQKVDFDKVVTPTEMGTRDLKEYLVQLAWMNSPENEALELEQTLREFELKSEKKDWTNDVRFSVNLNENNFRKEDTIFIGTPGISGNGASNSLFPIFNFNASVSLGTFVNRKNKVGIAEQRVKIAESNINQKKLRVRYEILRRYEEYEMQEETLKAVTQAEQSASEAYLLITDLFKADKETFENYNSANTTYHSAVEKRIKANADLAIAKLKIEEMIGISFDEAQRMRK